MKDLLRLPCFSVFTSRVILLTTQRIREQTNAQMKQIFCRRAKIFLNLYFDVTYMVFFQNYFCLSYGIPTKRRRRGRAA